ncbi:MAG: BamA/TamA family outer membrane protein [Chitinophagaceae bacterium]
MTLHAAHFFKSGKQTTLKTGIQAGWVASPLIFRNELFQMGGFKTLRGFDEESIFASQYGIFTTEYRLLTGLNSYLFAFADLGWVRNNSMIANTTHRFLGSGLGISFENKAGLFNLAFAFGKRNDQPMNLRQSKIHFGYVNFF